MVANGENMFTRFQHNTEHDNVMFCIVMTYSGQTGLVRACSLARLQHSRNRMNACCCHIIIEL